MQAPLGEFELVVLMSVLHVLHLGHDANGSAVRTDLERRIGRRVSRGSVYVTLDRLEEKGLLSSRLVAAPTVRGGTKRLFLVTAAGVKAVKHAVATVERMRQGLEPILGKR
jgi:DNA-binding PadR family transcriptional regulator